MPLLPPRLDSSLDISSKITETVIEMGHPLSSGNCEFDSRRKMQNLEAALSEAARLGKEKRFIDALRAAAMAKSCDPNSATAHALAAQALFGLEQYKKALGGFQRCKELLKFYSDHNEETAATLLKCDKGIAACFHRLGSHAAADIEDAAGALPVEPSAFPRTPHLSFSPGVGDDDIVRSSHSLLFGGKEVVITEKLDGGNCCFWQGMVFARSHAHPTSLPWFSTAKQIASIIVCEQLLPGHIALFLENLEAIHSIDYGRLSSPLFVIAALDTRTSRFLAWDDLHQLALSLSLPTPPGVTEEWLREWAATQQASRSRVGDSGTQPEGFVIREVGEIQMERWQEQSSKYVRRGHLQTPADFHRTWKKAAFDLPL